MQFMADLVLTCDECHGKRFKKDILDVKFEGKNIYDILEMTVNQAIDFFMEHSRPNIARSLKPLQYLGLGKTKPTLFIFDEPTTGLHFHDTKKLLLAFNSLIDKGHSVIVIEHNMEIIKSADYIIDLGPEGGRGGGKIIAQGTPEQVAKCEESYTAKFLQSKLN